MFDTFQPYPLNRVNTVDIATVNHHISILYILYIYCVYWGVFVWVCVCKYLPLIVKGRCILSLNSHSLSSILRIPCLDGDDWLCLHPPTRDPPLLDLPSPPVRPCQMNFQLNHESCILGRQLALVYRVVPIPRGKSNWTRRPNNTNNIKPPQKNIEQHTATLPLRLISQSSSSTSFPFSRHWKALENQTRNFTFGSLGSVYRVIWQIISFRSVLCLRDHHHCSSAVMISEGRFICVPAVRGDVLCLKGPLPIGQYLPHPNIHTHTQTPKRCFTSLVRRKSVYKTR